MSWKYIIGLPSRSACSDFLKVFSDLSKVETVSDLTSFCSKCLLPTINTTIMFSCPRMTRITYLSTWCRRGTKWKTNSESWSTAQKPCSGTTRGNDKWDMIRKNKTRAEDGCWNQHKYINAVNIILMNWWTTYQLKLHKKKQTKYSWREAYFLCSVLFYLSKPIRRALRP